MAFVPPQKGVQGVEGATIHFLSQQIHSCLSDIGADVIKTGMLATAEVVEATVCLDNAEFCLSATSELTQSCTDQ